MSHSLLYRTARATLSCAKFKAGELVAIAFTARIGGTNWFHVTATERGALDYPVAYPEHHLKDFVL